MLPDVKRFDMKRPAMRMHLGLLMRVLTLPTLLSHKNKLTKIGMEGIKPPYVLLCNHNAFMDFSVALKATRFKRVNFVVAIDGYLKREWLLRFIGCICKRKFTRDITLIKQLKLVKKRGDIAAIYPEARYSLCGTTAVLPESVGKLAKMLDIPIVTLICHGHHVNSPFFNLPDHKVKGTEATMTCLLTPEQLRSMSAEEIQKCIEKAFVYDDYAWQAEKKIAVTYPKRAEGLQKVLYQCPHCGREYRMSASGATLRCDECGKAWSMDEYGALKATEGETEFSHIPDWYEWERGNVRREVRAGKYGITLQARGYALPNASGFIDVGNAVLTHDMSGFTVRGHYKGEDYELIIKASTQYSVHIEYEYLGKYGDCVDLNTLNDTLYVHPEGRDYSVTKMALATEELYALYNEQA